MKIWYYFVFLPSTTFYKKVDVTKQWDLTLKIHKRECTFVTRTQVSVHPKSRNIKLFASKFLLYGYVYQYYGIINANNNNSLKETD